MADRISILPVYVLCHILSFLPTKEAVATSVLSKKWNPLWRFVPTLDFNFNCRSYENGQWREKYSSFVQSVYEVILSRDLHQSIQTFRLSCKTFDCDPKDIKIWVNAAIHRRVEHLDLTLHFGFFAFFEDLNMNLPSAIFRHRTLVVLKLKGILLKDVSSVDLPSLKILHLDNVRSLEIRYLSNLLSGCPVLEVLEAKDLYFDNSYQRSSTHREFKRLPKLIRADIFKLYIPLVILSNVEFLSIDKGLDVDNMFYDQEKDMENGDDPNPYAKDLIPVFRNLVHVELTFFYETMNWLDVIEVIKHCPKLQILVIDQNFNYVDDYDDIDWRYPRSGVPKCIALHLKTCQLNNYKGSKGEVRFARYVMRNARVLQTMRICVNADTIRDEQLNKFKMLKKLSLCTRRSRTCKLSFEII